MSARLAVERGLDRRVDWPARGSDTACPLPGLVLTLPSQGESVNSLDRNTECQSTSNPTETEAIF